MYLLVGWDESLGIDGGGNIDADPLIIDAEGGNFRLASGSPCIDAGFSSAVPTDLYDLDKDGDIEEPLPFDLGGNARI